MSVFGGKINFISTYAQDFTEKNNLKRTVSIKPQQTEKNNIIACYDDMVTVNLKNEELVCGCTKCIYRDLIKNIKCNNPKIGMMYFQDDLDVLPILRREEDMKKSIYGIDYSNEKHIKNGRFRNISCEKLQPDTLLPLTTHQSSFRYPPKITTKEYDRTTSITKHVEDNTLKKEIEQIIGTKCGETVYSMGHGLLGQTVLETKPYGEPNEAPLCSRWQGTPGNYRYLIR